MILGAQKLTFFQVYFAFGLGLVYFTLVLPCDLLTSPHPDGWVLRPFDKFDAFSFTANKVLYIDLLLFYSILLVAPTQTMNPD